MVEKNPDYFLPGPPKIDRVVMNIIPEYTTSVAGLESGAIDIVYDLPPEQKDQLKDSHVSRVEEVASGRWQGIVFNNAFKPFDDPRVREAFIKLVDKQAFTDIATFGHGALTVSPIPPTHPYFRKDLLTPPDIPGAKKLLAEAGLGNGFPLEMFVPALELALGRAARDGLPRRRKAGGRDGVAATVSPGQVLLPRWRARCRSASTDSSAAPHPT